MGDPRNARGAFSWLELMTTDPAAAEKFYTAVFGWKTTVMKMQDGTDYKVIGVGERQEGGMMRMPPGLPSGVPPHWGVYVTVEDADFTAKKVEELGGKVLNRLDVPEVGRIVVIQDPQGAVISAIQYERPFG